MRQQPGETGDRAQDREILRLALPAFGALAAEPLYVLADTAIVGHLGTRPLGGLGVSAAVLLAVFGVFNFLIVVTHLPEVVDYALYHHWFHFWVHAALVASALMIIRKIFPEGIRVPPVSPYLRSGYAPGQKRRHCENGW